MNEKMIDRRGLSIDELAKQIEGQKEPSNAIAKLTLKNLKHYVSQAKEIIKANENRATNLEDEIKRVNEYSESLKSREEKINRDQASLTQWKKTLDSYEQNLLLNTDRIGLETAIALVPKTFLGFPRSMKRIYKDAIDIKDSVTAELTPIDTKEELILKQ